MRMCNKFENSSCRNESVRVAMSVENSTVYTRLLHPSTYFKKERPAFHDLVPELESCQSSLNESSANIQGMTRA